MADERRYDDEDVKAVIARAVERQSGGALTHADLLGIGEELGLSKDDIENAALEVSEKRRETEATRAIVSRRRKWLALHGLVFAVLNGLLFTINALTTPGEWWFLFPVVSWGLLLLLHAGFTWGMKVSPRDAAKVSRRMESKRASRALPRHRVEASAAPEDENVDEAMGATAPQKKTFP